MFEWACQDSCRRNNFRLRPCACAVRALHLEGGPQQVDHKQVQAAAHAQVLRGLLEEALLDQRRRSGERRAEQVQAREHKRRATCQHIRASVGAARGQGMRMRGEQLHLKGAEWGPRGGGKQWRILDAGSMNMR